jgi:hypothetical protein
VVGAIRLFLEEVLCMDSYCPPHPDPLPQGGEGIKGRISIGY